VAGTLPKFASGECVTHSGAEACFEKHGDKIWVLDTSGNGVEADADWENFLRDTTGGWTQYRAGACLNTLTHGNWGVCNMDFYEDTTFNHYGGYGSGLRLAACDGGACSSEIWIRNNA
jgi:hypothetical protein